MKAMIPVVAFAIVAFVAACVSRETQDKLDLSTRQIEALSAERGRLESELERTKARLALPGGPTADTSVMASRINDLTSQIEKLKLEHAATEVQADEERAAGWDMGGRLISDAGGSLLTMFGIPGGAAVAGLVGHAMAGVAASKRRKANGNG